MNMQCLLRIGVLAFALVLIAGCTSNDDPQRAECQVSAMLPEPDTSSAPRDVIALNNWMLILPADSEGGTSGPAATVSTDSLVNGYSSEWFFASQGGGVAFWAPVNGALLPKSPFPRTELREVLEPSDPNVNWSVTGTGQLTAQVSVDQVPNANGTVILAQIVGHEPEAEEFPSLMRLGYNLHAGSCTGSLFGTVAESPDSGAPSQQIVLIGDGIALNQVFGFSVTVSNGMLTLASGTNEQTVAIDASWNDTPVYFMAGAGLGIAGTSETEGAGVTFHELAVTH